MMAPVLAGEDGERPRLSKAAVIDGALKLADADGLDTLTIRKLATHLGVTPMALYWHFRSKEELLDAVAYQVRTRPGSSCSASTKSRTRHPWSLPR